MKICAEEHFSTRQQIDYFRAIHEKKYPVREVVEQESHLLTEVPFLGYERAELFNQLYDLGTGRINEMDTHGLDVQVLSLFAPGVQVFDAETASRLARQFNDLLGAAIKEHPKRFVGLACVAPQKPDEAADELERAVKELGCKGAVINGHTKGEYPDNRKNWVIFERAERLNVPIYLHPRCPAPDMMKPYLDHPLLATAIWGYAAEAGLQAMRLIFSGVFDEFPRLKFILGHLGEGIPFFLARIDNRYLRIRVPKTLKKLPSQYFKENFAVTTSGMYTHAPLLLVLSVLGPDNVLFAVDYPFEDPEEAVLFMDKAPISDLDREKICHLNAERIFSL
jgi:5-carboxyvanillate decarboxylase